MCVQSEWKATFQFIHHNQNCSPKMFYYKKNVCSKQAGGCFLVYSSLIKCQMLYCKKCVLKANGGYFLVYSSTVLIRKRVLKASEMLLFSLFVLCSTLPKKCVENKREASFQFIYLMFYFKKCVFKASYFLVYSLLISIIRLKCFQQ